MTITDIRKDLRRDNLKARVCIIGSGPAGGVLAAELAKKKIDVEGFEWNVLQGAQETLKKFKPHILTEYDFDRHNYEQKPYDYKDLFESLGYRA